MASSGPPAAGGPCVLVIGGHDPSGAGIHADIETCAALDCLALSVVTALTTQNTAGLHGIRASDPQELVRQIELIAAEFPLAACKIGMVPTVAIAAALDTLLRGLLRGLPLVVDPVLRAGSGARLAEDEMVAAWRGLLAHAKLCTPNRGEAAALSGSGEPAAAGAALLALGCGAVLITDTAPDPAQIVNELYLPDLPAQRFTMERYPGEYHGTGCTLASALACGLARGEPLASTVAMAQQFVHRAVARARHFGTRQAIPNRAAAARP